MFVLETSQGAAAATASATVSAAAPSDTPTPSAATAAEMPLDNIARALYSIIPGPANLPADLLIPEADIRAAAFRESLRERAFSVHTPPSAVAASEAGELLNPQVEPPLPPVGLNDDADEAEEEGGDSAGASSNLRRSERNAAKRKS